MGFVVAVLVRGCRGGSEDGVGELVTVRVERGEEGGGEDFLHFEDGRGRGAPLFEADVVDLEEGGGEAPRAPVGVGVPVWGCLCGGEFF